MKTFILLVALALIGTTSQAQTPPDDGTHVITPLAEVHAPPGSSVTINHGGVYPPVVYPPTAYPAPVAYYPPRFFWRPRLRRAYWIGAGRPGPGYPGYPAGPRVRVNVH